MLHRQSDYSLPLAKGGWNSPRNSLIPFSDSAYCFPFMRSVECSYVEVLNISFSQSSLSFLPFLVIDLVVASVLVSMGMMFLPPTTIAMPFKLIMFVMVDGWFLITKSLIEGFVP